MKWPTNAWKRNQIDYKINPLWYDWLWKYLANNTKFCPACGWSLQFFLSTTYHPNKITILWLIEQWLLATKTCIQCYHTRGLGAGLGYFWLPCRGQQSLTATSLLLTSWPRNVLKSGAFVKNCQFPDNSGGFWTFSTSMSRFIVNW